MTKKVPFYRLHKVFFYIQLSNSRVGTMLEGREAVEEGLIDEVGGMKEALAKLYELIDLQKAEKKM